MDGQVFACVHLSDCLFCELLLLLCVLTAFVLARGTAGLDVFAYHKNPKKLRKALGKYLGPLLDFAKEVLKEKEDQWHTYPIFLKATGGMRTLPKVERVRLMEAIRDLLLDKTYNPFAFKIEQARVISGEEEAIYGWVGVNFAVAEGTLIHGSKGSGEARDPRLTYGMLEMGGMYFVYCIRQQ
ncbi:MAG: hypothetical protein SGILL_002289 [Bacillariaceae sp.]